MNSIKRDFSLIIYNLLKRIRNKESIICFFISGITVLKSSIGYLMYSKGHTVNFLEGYIQAMSGEANIMIIIFCAVILFSDAPFIFDNSILIIYRTKRKKWYLFSWIYMIIGTLLYMFYILVIGILPYIIKGYAENRWSQSMLKLMNGYKNSMDIYNINPVSEVFKNMTPINVTFYTTILCAEYILFLISILYVFNMIYPYKPFGTIAVGGIHIIVTLVNMLGVLVPTVVQRFSIYRSAFYLLGYDPYLSNGFFSILYIIFLIYLIYLIGLWVLPRVDIYLK